jgi:CRISPR-associated endoribonuclease Cas6
MRMKITLKSENNFSYNEIQSYFIHGLIWNLTKGTEFSKYHDLPKFKYFCFSEIFPPTNFKEGEEKTFFISSPDRVFMKFIYSKFKRFEQIKLGQYTFNIKSLKMFDLKFTKRWISGSPIVLQVERNVYWSKKYHSFGLFLKRLKENALKKYNSFYNENLDFEEDIFDLFILKKQVAVHLRKNQKEARIIGTKWIFEKKRYPKNLRKFYKFILDCGLGEKNSMGFGFVNPVKIL